MSVVPTRMILTPAFDDTKRMTVQGAVAVNETVAVTVVGVVTGGIVPAGMVLRLVSQCGRIEYARFPTNVGDAWTVSNADATCNLLLNTRALQGSFHQLCSDAVVESEVKLENGVTNNLYASGRLVIRNWIQNPLSPVAGSGQMQAQIDVLTERIGTHRHDDGEESASFPHNNLSGRDVTGAHPTIESGVANAALAAFNAQGTANTAGSNASAALVAVEAEEQARTLADNALTDAIALKQTAPSAGALVALAALEAVPEEYDESQVRAIVNAAIAALKGLYA